ncbi:N5-glutamine S-adenosyl-L-methionine-dependent methyltransferase [Bifidobacterium gallicum DSM 20093 = LMG 11596]|uniref:Release factor glutamine methyltransferase n=1 Tax=Bifidobacterium gallicum DSM 20093 = LMG 11596 TaxID=561180 RepID=A0A087ALE2_9BIFI|nr:N5-glutamine S-adenosyl-L-methionine-dependent methyltransferase [Bifidobacterium gallicum DSM 20093 = LMG 11596]
MTVSVMPACATGLSPAFDSAMRFTVDSSVAELLDNAEARLQAAGIDTPFNDAKLLLAHAAQVSLSDVDMARLMGRTLAQLQSQRNVTVSSDNTAAAFNTDCSTPHEPDAAAQFTAMLARREAREPLQHITGHAPFRYLDLLVGPGVFVPRPETESVVQAALDWMDQHGMKSPRVVDLCAGSGAIGLSVATEVPDSCVWAVEMDATAASWTRRNLDRVGATMPDLASRYRLMRADATCELTLADLDGTVDVVISNPPYIPEHDVPEQTEVREYDPDMALYGGSADGMMIPERIISRAWALLKPGGLLVMEHDISQPVRTRAFATAIGFSQAATHEDLTGRPRFLTAIKPK